MNNIIEGAIGEAEAAAYLKKKGYKIIIANYKNKIGEIDLIAEDGKTLVFVEVKKRKSAKFGLSREAVHAFKQQKIRNVALLYLQQKGNLDQNCRFDVIDILDGKIEHIKNAF